MLREPTITKMNELRMYTMAKKYQELTENSEYANVSFEEKVGLMVDSEVDARQSRRLHHLVKAAGLVFPDACVENVRYDTSRHLDRAMIVKLSTTSFIENARNVVILGATGTGKSYLGCALGNIAARNLLTVKYIRLPDLFADLEAARSSGKYRKTIQGYQKMKLLILDEWLLFPLSVSESRDLLEIMEARYGRASTIFCSQFGVEGWYEKIGDPTFADAICDRIINNAYTIKLEGESMRKIMNQVE